MSIEALSEHSFFFTKQERDTLAAAPARPPKHGGSLLGRLLKPLVALASRAIPESVAPNTIALMGVLSALQAFHVATTYWKSSSGAASPIVGALLFFSSLCSLLIDAHGKRCRSHSAVGNVFIECAAAARSVFFAATLVPVLGIEDNAASAWYFCVGMQLLRLVDMCLRVSNRVPGNVATASYLVTSAELTLAQLVLFIWKWREPNAPVFRKLVELLSPDNCRLLYNTALVLSIGAVGLLRAPQRSLLPLVVCLVSRAVPAFMLPFAAAHADASTISTLADACVVALLQIEVFISFQSQRTTHLAVTCIAVGSIFNAPLAIAASALYVVGVLTDLAFFTNTPLFVPIRNVYIDGVFDLCHVGHKRLMENALKHGNRLICGVMGDEDCCKYKRKPIMTTEERIAEVRACKHVSEVIPNAPCFGLTEEFLKQHNIHVVVYGEEYHKPDDIYYAAARKLNMYALAPRTGGISTSEIIKRIRAQSDEALAAKDKASGQSTVKEGK